GRGSKPADSSLTLRLLAPEPISNYVHCSFPQAKSRDVVGPADTERRAPISPRCPPHIPPCAACLDRWVVHPTIARRGPEPRPPLAVSMLGCTDLSRRAQASDRTSP